MQASVRFGIAGLCFLAFAIALGTLTPALNISNNVDDSPENPWIAVEVANGQISYALPPGMALGGADESETRLTVAAELKVDWNAPRSNGKDMATLGSVETPLILDEDFDLNAGGETNGIDDIRADYATDFCSPLSDMCFGGMNGGGYAEISSMASVQKPISDAMSDHRIWNHGRFQSSDSSQGQVCSPLKELCPNTVGVAPTPEPSGMALLGMGLIALAIASRKRLFA
ncbi:MAG TPA: PEP-CTERM sorting domain-containing protein [Candidatus Acidoferrales bacterium]|nr:PEP-CTERM sorting domain-containing protein [Candidatus Acidoferrales bacterium]